MLYPFRSHHVQHHQAGTAPHRYYSAVDSNGFIMAYCAAKDQAVAGELEGLCKKVYGSWRDYVTKYIGAAMILYRL